MGFMYCAVEGCTYASGAEGKRHRFPNPEKHPDLFEKWLCLCGNEKIMREYTRDRIYRNQRVCSKHFKQEHFGPNRVLKSGIAFPQLHLPKPLILDGEDNGDHDYHVVYLKKEDIQHVPYAAVVVHQASTSTETIAPVENVDSLKTPEQYYQGKVFLNKQEIQDVPYAAVHVHQASTSTGSVALVENVDPLKTPEHDYQEKECNKCRILVQQELIKEKISFIKLQKEKLIEEHQLKMEILNKELEIKNKKLELLNKLCTKTCIKR